MLPWCVTVHQPTDSSTESLHPLTNALRRIRAELYVQAMQQGISDG